MPAWLSSLSDASVHNLVCSIGMSSSLGFFWCIDGFCCTGRRTRIQFDVGCASLLPQRVRTASYTIQHVWEPLYSYNRYVWQYCAPLGVFLRVNSRIRVLLDAWHVRVPAQCVRQVFEAVQPIFMSPCACTVSGTRAAARIAIPTFNKSRFLFGLMRYLQSFVRLASLASPILCSRGIR